jgi:hypothetical protein
MGALAVAWGLTAAGLPVSVAKNRRHKPKKNEFGCLNVGKPCNGKNHKCCSGICKGKRPKKGKKDKSKCVAHNVAGCQVGQDGCLNLDAACGIAGLCYRTTGKAGFCGTSGSCTGCKKDTECEAEHGPGAACVVCPGCPTDPETLCIAADPAS